MSSVHRFYFAAHNNIIGAETSSIIVRILPSGKWAVGCERASGTNERHGWHMRCSNDDNNNNLSTMAKITQTEERKLLRKDECRRALANAGHRYARAEGRSGGRVFG